MVTLQVRFLGKNCILTISHESGGRCEHALGFYFHCDSGADNKVLHPYSTPPLRHIHTSTKITAIIKLECICICVYETQYTIARKPTQKFEIPLMVDLSNFLNLM